MSTNIATSSPNAHHDNNRVIDPQHVYQFSDKVAVFMTNLECKESDVKFTGFDFNLPPDATIEGIEVEIRARCLRKVFARYFEVTLFYDGYASPTVIRNTDDYPATFESQTAGSADDAWGRAWIPDDLTDNNFAVQLHNVGYAPCYDLEVRHLIVKVHYSQGT